jgi:uncharacterized membrane protein YbhN (UPF0104 family)
METDTRPEQINSSHLDLRKCASITIRFLVSAGILCILYSLVKWDNVILAYKSARLDYLSIAALLVSLNIGLKTWKWQRMLGALKAVPTFSEAFGSVMLGISLGSFTPGEIGEFAGRALHISDAKRTHLVGLALVDKTQIFIVTSCVGILSLSVLLLHSFWTILVITSICTGLSLFILFRLDMIASFGHRFNNRFLRIEQIGNIWEGFALLSAKENMITLTFTFLVHVVITLQLYFLVNAFEPLAFISVFIATSALLFSKSFLPISLGDLGIREAGAIFFFQMYGIAQTTALNASLLLFVVNIFLPSVAGVYFLKHHHLVTIRTTRFFTKGNRT